MTPVQIPFKRNFKDMENKFEYLKIDGREQLPAPWSDYPVLREYETVTVYRNGRDYLDALVGQQDGWWVAGVHMEVGGSGGGFTRHLYVYSCIVLIINTFSRREKVKMYTFYTPTSQSSLRFVLQRYNENPTPPNRLTYILSLGYTKIDRIST